MRRSSKKILCVIFSILMILPFGLISSFAASCNCDAVPYVMVRGQSDLYIMGEDGQYHEPLEEDSYDIPEMAKELLPLLMKAVSTGDWSEYGKRLYDYIAPTYAALKVDGDGVPVDKTSGVHPNNRWTYEKVSPNHWKHCGELHEYLPDQRLAVMDAVDDLHNFIEAVKAKTGHDKVNLVGRCLGTNYVMAYLYKYGMKDNFSDINRVVLFYGTHNGTPSVNALLSGNLRISSDAAVRYIHAEGSLEDLDNSELAELLLTTIDMLRETYSDKVALKIIHDLYENIKDPFLSPLMRDSYGSYGGNLALANDNYKEAIDYIYPTDELKQEYAGLIRKADEYHYGVQDHMADIMHAAEDAGVPVFTMAQYGYQQNPFGGDRCEYLGEYTADLRCASNGATTSKVNGTLSDKYIQKRIDAGFGKYISPDKQVDASTCILPDRTWIIKNIDHDNPNSVMQFLNFLVFSKEAPTIDTSEKYPQFMNYIEATDTLVPLQAVNAEDIDWNAIEDTNGEATKTIIDKVRTFFEDLIQKIKDSIKFLIDLFKIEK